MSIEENKALVQRYIEEAWNNGNTDVLDELLDPDFNSGGYGAIAGMKAGIAAYRTSFPDLHFTIEEAIGEEDKIAYRWIARGTHQGVYDGVAPTESRLRSQALPSFVLLTGASSKTAPRRPCRASEGSSNSRSGQRLLGSVVYD